MVQPKSCQSSLKVVHFTPWSKDSFREDLVLVKLHRDADSLGNNSVDKEYVMIDQTYPEQKKKSEKFDEKINRLGSPRSSASSSKSLS